MSAESGGGVAVMAPGALTELPDLHSFEPIRHGARLTRRGRVVLISTLAAVTTAGFAVLILVAVALGASPAGASADSLMLPPPETIVVRDGDTLWGIAEQVRPDDDPRRTVHEIVEINDLTSTTLEPGQKLELPS
ncbi:nucleoid-associated protein YgaU [Spinactinospora alkalitolerans]|uniref:Nucleoid-associated protein YgaU n=1 Tax=Spinactinospora alkalitolerans TaxID=687207 RepID=A0A852TWG2_9ACTN|nr:LysM peptidoglycan-binding domain-containing protein [Spinactinospora alkalitolerans]NYE46414.1 nucleoid-associated protein YgaU [Spinactinospora alkalitolerans]